MARRYTIKTKFIKSSPFWKGRSVSLLLIVIFIFLKSVLNWRDLHAIRLIRYRWKTCYVYCPLLQTIACKSIAKAKIKYNHIKVFASMVKGHYPTGQYTQIAWRCSNITDQHLVMRQTLVRHYALSSTSHCEQTYNLHRVHSGQNVMMSEYSESEVWYWN